MKMMKTRVSSARLRCLLLLLLALSASFSCSAAAPRDAKLRLLLHRSPPSSKQDLSRSSLAELLLSDLLQVENEAVEEDGFGPGDGQPEDVHVDLERAAGGGPLLAPRERKAGCKNFFWKTFTSC
ncbi:somatostatin 1, tandem duplicate 1 [Salarias fasciatus]|uniref:somatostatin 1, tandem duplicate 1 n=1 Tax=Salarias fasciatus TaxID=181472 RepID=UPI00117666E6|nr:somatostatin-1-like [Salarias fasciatus]